MVRIWLLAGVGTVFTEKKKGATGDEKGIYVSIDTQSVLSWQEGEPS